MSDVSPPDTPTGPDRFDSWKEIAAYMRRDITTVQRWEKREGMPVHRHLHDRMGSVYAFRHELDAWSQGRRLVAADPAAAASDSADAGPDAAPSSGSRGILPRAVWAVPAVLTLAALIAWSVRDAPPWNPLADARYLPLTDWGGISQAAALSRDGKYAAFLSDREGRIDVWVTQIGTGQFYRRTADASRELANASIRTVAFSPDGSLVTFWTRRTDDAGRAEIGVWGVPVLGGAPKPYLEGAAEYDWSRDNALLAFHTPADGDPTFVRRAADDTPPRLLYAAPDKRHSHFPTWSPDGEFVYFVQGVPGRMDIWRIPAAGGEAERITHHDSAVTYPVFLDERTLLYLAADPDGSGPHVYGFDVGQLVPRRLTAGVDRFTSLSASADGARLLATLARPDGTLWRLPLESGVVGVERAERITLTTGNGSSPRLGAGYLLYVSSKGTTDGIWRLQDDGGVEVWSAPDSRVVGGPAIAPDGRRMVFSVRQKGRVRLYVADIDGTSAREVSASFEPDGDAAWVADGRSIVVASPVAGTPHLFRVQLETGQATPVTREYAVDPAPAPDGQAFVYSGADVGTTFLLKAVALDGGPSPLLPPVTLSRGARRLVFLPGTRSLVFLRGEITHKNLWTIDLDNGRERQLTDFVPGFDVYDFDVSPDGREIVLEQVQERSEIVLIERSRH